MSSRGIPRGTVLFLILSLVLTGCGDDRASGPLPAPADIYWEHISDSRIIRISGFAFGANGTVFAASLGGGLYRSMDNGESWAAANDGLPNDLVQCVAVAEDGTVFVGLYNEGIYRSTDNAETWESANNGLFPITTVWAIAIDAEGTIFPGMGNGTYRSTDNGESWESLDPGEAGSCYPYDIVVSPTGDIFVSCAGTGIFRSSDGGESWTLVAETFYCDLYPGTYSARRLRIDAAGTIYAIISNACCLYRSTDGGGSWYPLPVEPIDVQIWDLTVTEVGAIYIGTANSGVYRSLDDGALWDQTNAGLWERHISAMGTDGHGALYAGSYLSGIIYRRCESEDTWRQVNNAMPSIVRRVFTTSKGTIIAATGGNIYRSTDHGANWNPSSRGIGGYANCLVESAGGVLFTGTSDAGVYRSDDDGASWTAANAGIEDDAIRDIAVDRHGTVIASGADNGVVRSSDGGRTWRDMNHGLNGSTVISLIAKGDDTYFAGTSINGIFFYNEHARAWRPFNEGLTDLHIKAIAFMPPYTLYASTPKGIFSRIIFRDSWYPMSDEGMTGSSMVSTLAVNNARHLYALISFSGSTLKGLYRWITERDEWEQINVGIPKNIYDFALDREGCLYAATQEGVFQTAEPTY